MKHLLALWIALSALAGCGQVAVFGHTIGEADGKSSDESAPAVQNDSARADSSPAAQSAVGPSTSILGVPKVKAVSVVLAAEAAAKITEDKKFNVDVLRSAIESELRSREALDESASPTTAVAEIVIDEYALNPVSNAILFGYIIHTGTLVGVLRVRDTQGNQRSSRLEAKSQVSIPAQGESKNPLAPLYDRFAVVTGNTLTGKIIKPVESDNWRPR